MTNPVIDKDGNKYWYNSEGFLHREDGPACEYYDGSKSWWINGQLHREDGPAIEGIDGSTHWYINGLFHRDNGPAYEGGDGTKEWFIKNINITEEVNQWIKDNNFPDHTEWVDNIKVLFKLKFG